MTVNLAASIHARLLARARVEGQDFTLLLTRFALERLLFRLSVSRHALNFLLKGALLFALWYDQPHRPTRDVDLLGFGPDDADTLAAVFHDVCDIVADDGMVFDGETVAVATIRDENEYGGLRVTLTGRLGNARIPIQIDIGFGDAVTPAPERITYPVLIALGISAGDLDMWFAEPPIEPARPGASAYSEVSMNCFYIPNGQRAAHAAVFSPAPQ